MRHAIYMPAGDAFADARALADLARDAEQAGWDGFFVWDHIHLSWTEQTLDPCVGLTAVALNTTRIRLGTLVTPLPRRRPAKLARETATLDRLSGGRLILGVGTGGGQAEWDDLGEATDPKTRGAMLDEGLQVITCLWSGETINFQGKFYRAKGLRFLPTPQQTPRIPIWVGGFWPHQAPMRRAARWDGVFPLFDLNLSGEEKLAQFKQAVAYVRAQRQSAAPFDIISVGYTEPGRAAEIVAPYDEAGATWWMECLDPWRFGWTGQGPWPVEVMRQRVQCGPGLTS
jgi:probable F420-dependent oxidoreductase